MGLGAVLGALLGMAGCAASGPHRSAARDAAAPAAAAGSGVAAPLERADVEWLERVGFGVDRQMLADYRRLGRERFLDRQLHPPGDELPPWVAAQIEALDISHLDLVQTLAQVHAQRRALRTLSDADAQLAARRALFAQGNRLATEAAERELLRAVYSGAQLREQMVWFWLNHFSVFRFKADLPWLVADYEERAIRPHALGHFRDLVLATLQSPAMLEYLDNARSYAGHVNENYAREFMELHTLGVGSGYTQQDVQQLARIFTGVGIDVGPPRRVPPAVRAWYVRDGAFAFNPRRHDAGTAVLLGQRFSGHGFDEVERAVTLIVRQPACARFISRELATYFVSDDPPPALVAQMAQTFQRTDGDIAAVLRTMFLSPQFDAALGAKFKDPMRYVISAVRLAYDGRVIRDPLPLLNWVRYLGEAPYGRQTPDGYPLTAPSWDSSGQMSRRFEVARIIAGGNPLLFRAQLRPAGAPPAAAPRPVAALVDPLYSDALYREAVKPFLGARTRAALQQARTPQEWNTFLLASPELNYE